MNCPFCKSKLYQILHGKVVNKLEVEKESFYPIIYTCAACEKLFIMFEASFYEIPLVDSFLVRSK